MLRSFRVENHKSIREEQELNLLAAYDKSRPVVPVAAVFGANASGKSNLLDALRWLQAAVLNSFASWQPGAGVPRTPFRLDPKAVAEPSGYSVDVVIDGARYVYGLIVDDERVREEWLFTYPHNRRRVIFERTGDTIRLGSTVPDYRARGDLLAGLTRPNASLLSVAAHVNQVETQPVYNWFRTGLRFLAASREDPSDTLLARLGGSAAQRTRVVDLVRAADLGICDIELVNNPYGEGHDALRIDAVVLMQELQAARKQLHARLRDEDDSGKRVELEREVHSVDQRLADVIRTDVMLRASQELPPRLIFRHGQSAEPFTLADESAGTRAWLSVGGAALDVLDTGAVLVIDELDMSLHPQLAAMLVNLFRDSQANPRSAQLLFTTHDATLLSRETLARDEVWFVEKDVDNGATKLYPLTDFHPRKNENTEGRYLAGGYGAVPVLSAFELLTTPPASTTP